jgi:hypothetical protein
VELLGSATLELFFSELELCQTRPKHSNPLLTLSHPLKVLYALLEKLMLMDAQTFEFTYCIWIL